MEENSEQIEFEKYAWDTWNKCVSNWKRQGKKFPIGVKKRTYVDGVTHLSLNWDLFDYQPHNDTYVNLGRVYTREMLIEWDNALQNFVEVRKF